MMKVLLIIAVVGLMSCNTADINNTKKKSSSLLPMGTDMEWVYEYDEKSNPKTKSFRINHTYGSFGQFYGKFDSFPCLGKDYEVDIVIYRDLSYNISSFMFIPPPEKIKTGYSWESSEWKCRVVSESEEVKTFDKTYENCVYISYSLSITFSAHIWYKEGVGIVKWQFLRTNPPTTELGHYLLKTYSIK